MKKNLMKILRYILCFFVLLLIDISLIILMNKIPSNFLENNIKESAIVLKEQGERYIVNLGYKKETIFNFTDALMLNMAYSVDHNKPIDAMLLSRKDYIAGFTKYENTAAETNIGTDTRFIDKETGDVWHTKELYQFINEKDME